MCPVGARGDRHAEKRQCAADRCDPELLEVQVEDREDKLLALYQLGAAAPQRDKPRVLAAFKLALTDEDPDLRYATLVAIPYSGWPELKDSVRQLSRENPSDMVRSAADCLLEGYEQQPGPAT